VIDYASIAENALDAIADAGTTGVLARFVKTFDPVLSTVSARSVVKTDIDMVVLPVSKSDNLDTQDERFLQDLHLGKLRKFLVASTGIGFVPLPKDVVLYANLFWEVMGVTTLSPAGTDVIHTLLVRKSMISEEDMAASDLDSLECWESLALKYWTEIEV
jgi:hypothetical protein